MSDANIPGPLRLAVADAIYGRRLQVTGTTGTLPPFWFLLPGVELVCNVAGYPLGAGERIEAGAVFRVPNYETGEDELWLVTAEKQGRIVTWKEAQL